MSNNLGLCYSFHVGWYRYAGGSAKPWIACAVHNDDAETMSEKFLDLDAGDTEAINALEFIKSHAEIYAFAETPSEAIKQVEQQVLQRLS